MTTDENDKMLSSHLETAEVWRKFLKSQFATITKEELRSDMEVIPVYSRPGVNLDRRVFELVVKNLNNNKVPDPDEVSVEVYKNCPNIIRDELFKSLEFIYNEKYVPKSMECGRFVVLRKRKGSTNNPTKYRCI